MESWLAFAVLLLVGLPAVFLMVAFALHYHQAATRDAAPSAHDYFTTFMREWMWTVVFVLSFPLAYLPFLWQARPGGPPLLLVHGYLANRACWFALYWRLRRHGYAVAAVNLSPILGPVEAQAAGVAKHIRAMAETSGAPVIVIGHSLGGVVLRQCLHAEPELPVAQLVTIASPHQGTTLAYFGDTPVSQQLRPGSSFLAQLGAPQVPFVSVFSTLDQIVLPNDSAAQGDTKLAFAKLGHKSLIYDARVATAIIAAIGERMAADTVSRRLLREP